MLKLEMLNYLYRVYQFNSIRLAAESIPVAPSTISSALHKLEKDWGITLLERTYRGVELTAAAQAIAVASKNLFMEADKIESLIKVERAKCGQLNTAAGQLTLILCKGWWQGSTEIILPYLLKQGLDVNLPDYALDNMQYLQMVESDPLTVLINFFVEPADKLLASYPHVRSSKLNASKPCIVLAHNSELIAPDKKDISLKEAVKLPFLRFTEGYDQAFPIFEMLEEYGPLNIVENISNVQVLTAMLACNKGVSVGAKGNIIRPLSTQGESLRFVPLRTDTQLSLILCCHENLPEGYLAVLQAMLREFI